MRMNFIMSRMLAVSILVFAGALKMNAQTLEWQLANVVYSSTDPDAGGPATGTVSFTLRVRTVAGTLPNVTGISTGWSWQSTNAMLPTGPVTAPTCGTNSIPQPSNVVMDPAFGPGWTFNNVNQCSGTVSYVTDGKTFDRRAVGTVDGGTINLTTTWVNIFTATLWTLGSTNPHGGYAVINSGSGGSPGGFGTYAVSDDLANEYVVNSLTYSTALSLGPPVVTPVLFTNYDVICGDKGAIVTWSTATEINSNHFDIEKNTGAGWVTVGSLPGAGNSNSPRKYQYLDLEAGTALYRIKQVDDDGRFVFTAQRSKSCTGKLVNVVIYPVPTSNVLNVAIRTDRPIRTQLQVYDMSGRIVKSQAASLNNGNNNLTINVAELAAGEYILRSTDGTLQLDKKFTIAR